MNTEHCTNCTCIISNDTCCPDESYNGDGWCDACNNKENCAWDGGDCCEGKLVQEYCDPICECLDPNHGQTTTTATTEEVTTIKTTPPGTVSRGNRICHSLN